MDLICISPVPACTCKPLHGKRLPACRTNRIGRVAPGVRRLHDCHGSRYPKISVRFGDDGLNASSLERGTVNLERIPLQVLPMLMEALAKVPMTAAKRALRRTDGLGQ